MTFLSPRIEDARSDAWTDEGSDESFRRLLTRSAVLRAGSSLCAPLTRRSRLFWDASTTAHLKLAMDRSKS
jgi:hypothetical protein